MSFTVEECPLSAVEEMCNKYHGYGGAGKTAVYAFCVMEEGSPVASFAWQPPPPGAAKKVGGSFPQGVLALSRMVAVPKANRALKHISKPLKVQMKRLIDRTRWPVLVTYSDESLGHTGYVYQCSGWTPTERRASKGLVRGGRRVSTYSAGQSRTRKDGDLVVNTVLQRWEHRVCPPGSEWDFAYEAGWRRVPTGRVWRSGNPAYTYIKEGK